MWDKKTEEPYPKIQVDQVKKKKLISYILLLVYIAKDRGPGRETLTIHLA